MCVCVCVTRRVARCCLSSPRQVRVADGRTLKLQPTALQLVDEAGEPIVAEAVNGNGADGANGKNGASEAATHVERLRRRACASATRAAPRSAPSRYAERARGARSGRAPENAPPAHE